MTVDSVPESPVGGVSRVRLACLDTPLLSAASVFALLGLVMLASVTIAAAETDLAQPLQAYTLRQAMSVGLGVVLGIGVFRLSLARLQGAGVVWLLGAFALLVAVLIPSLGIRLNGAQSWLNLGLFWLLVAVPAKLMLLLYLAVYLARHGRRMNTGSFGFLPPIILISLAAALLLQQPSVGAMLLLVAIAMGMMRSAGARLWQLVCMLGLVLLIWWLSTPRSFGRIHSMETCFGLPADPFSSGFAGEWIGVGLGAGDFSLLAPDLARSDWMFSLLAQELGVLGLCAVVILYAVVVWRAFAIALQARKVGNPFAALLAHGIGIWIGLQALLHVAVNMGLLPSMGWTLPLLSYGGSSMVVMCVAIALLLRVDVESRDTSSTQ